MELRQIKGDTWCLEGAELIPLVRLPGDRCVLLDSGHAYEAPALTAALEGAGLTPLGVFCSHAHVDHAGNNSYLRKRYGARICLPLGEAALSASLTMYKAVYNAFTPRSLEARNGHLLGPADETVGTRDGVMEFCSVPFQVVHTPGHTPDHICTVTPDGVLYVADALMAGQVLESAKLPYHALHEEARQSMEKLRHTPCALCAVAHQGVTEDLPGLVDANLAALDRLSEDLLSLAAEPVSMDQLCLAYYHKKQLLTTHVEKAALYARNVDAMAEYLVDMGRMEIQVREGLRYFVRT